MYDFCISGLCGTWDDNEKNDFTYGNGLIDKSGKQKLFKKGWKYVYINY